MVHCIIMNNHPEIVVYPYCLQDGLLVCPEDVQEDHGDLTCLACSSSMITVKDGDRNHFEHSPGPAQECTVESALHEASKIAIRDGFNVARTVGFTTFSNMEALWLQCGGPPMHAAAATATLFSQTRIKPMKY